MKTIKDIIITIITLIAITFGIVAGVVFFTGHEEYKVAVNKVGLDITIEQLQLGESYTKLEDVSKDFLTAIVAIEDRRFLEHGGVDIISLGRALINNIKAGQVIEGGSTITQQLAKNLYFDSNQEFTRKVAELFLSRELEKNYSKEEILELYINIIYFGNDSYGIKEATMGYFEKLPSEITYDEATLLAGVPQAPSRYDLTKNLAGAREKQKYVEKAIIENFE